MYKFNLIKLTNIVYTVQYRNYEFDLEGFSIREVDYKNINDASSFRKPEIIKKFCTFLDSGQKGYYLYDENSKCVAHGWVIFNKKKRNFKANKYINISPNSVLIHFCNIDPNYRGRGLYKSFLKKIYQTIPYNLRIIIDTNEKNITARKGIEKSGAIEVYRLRIYKVNSKVILTIKLKN